MGWGVGGGLLLVLVVLVGGWCWGGSKRRAAAALHATASPRAKNPTIARLYNTNARCRTQQQRARSRRGVTALQHSSLKPFGRYL